MAKKDLKSYFPHDANARNDEKIIRLRMKHGAAGYGVYFMILERLRDATDYMSIKDYNIIAFDLRVDAALIKSVVEDFGLFVFAHTDEGEYIYSESFTRRMEMKDEVSEKRRAAASKRWGTDGNNKSNANAMQMQNSCKASEQQKQCNKSKEKEKKINKKISTDVDTKKSTSETSCSDDFSSVEADIGETLRQVEDRAQAIAESVGASPAEVVEMARQVAEKWRLTGEYDRERPLTHMINTIGRKAEAAKASKRIARAAEAVESGRDTRHQRERRELDDIHAVDSKAALQEYLKSKGLDENASLADVAAAAEPEKFPFLKTKCGRENIKNQK